jgi:hypothetical protein
MSFEGYTFFMDLRIREATYFDIQGMLEVITDAQTRMIEEGNPGQWGRHSPSVSRLCEEIKTSALKVVVDEKKIIALFALIPGEDPTYIRIDGKWNDDSQYYVIHSLASSSAYHGMFAYILDYAKSFCPHIRMDTHKDNKTMRHLFIKHGFTYCGITRVEDGTERLCYELSQSS